MDKLRELSKRVVTKKKKRRLVPRSYRIFRNISSHTLRECMDADKANAALYQRRLNDYASACQKLREDGLEFEIKSISPPPTNNTQRFHVFSARKTLVPAVEQTEAVLALERMGLHVFRDYEPQTAIVRYRELKSAAPSAPTSSPAGSPPEEEELPLYPSLTPVAGLPEGYSHGFNDKTLI